MGIALLRGRTFTESESFIDGGRRVVVVDEALARQLWPGGDALGQQVEFATEQPDAKPVSMEVVGIVSSTRRQLFEKDFTGGVYVPFAQGPRSNAYFHVRPALPGAALTDSVRREIRAAAPALPLFSTQTFASHMDNALEYWALQVTAVLFAAFGGLAMVVALVGIYGVLSYAVTRRTREIGIRIAVGATAGGVKRMIVGEGLTLTVIGVSIGLLLGVGVGQLLGSIFVDVSAFDFVVFTSVPIFFLTAALLASWLPARRATRVNPMTALRTD
jgi:putative ABC transport system permease protein